LHLSSMMLPPAVGQTPLARPGVVGSFSRLGAGSGTGGAFLSTLFGWRGRFYDEGYRCTLSSGVPVSVLLRN
jgi:hypothetical protein